MSLITKPAKSAASIFSLLVPVPQNGVIEGSIYGGGANGRSSPMEITSKIDNQPRSLSSDSPTRPMLLSVGQGVCKTSKMEKRLPALNIGRDEDDDSLPCTPETPSTPDYEATSQEVLDIETRQLLGIFLREHSGLSVSRCNRNQRKPLSTMKRVVDDVIDKHRLAYKGMISKLGLDERGDDMSVITSVAQQIFNDGTTNWGRIVSLVAFGACVCQHQKDRGQEHCVELVAQEISTYLLSDQRDWITKNNAWEGFVEFFHIADPEASVRNTLMAFAGVAGIGATLALLIR